MPRGASVLSALLAASAGAWASNLTSQALHEGRTVLLGHQDAVPAVAFAPSGRALISGGRDRFVRVWDVSISETAFELAASHAHSDAVFAAAFAPDGESYATGGVDKTVIIWDAASRRLKHRLSARPASIFALAYSADSSLLAAGGDDGAVRVWSARSGKSEYSLAHGRALRAVAVSKDGLIASGADDGSLRVWTPRRSRKAPSATVALAHAGGVSATAFSPDGALLATAGADRAIRIWSLPDARLVAVFRGHVGAPSSLAFFSDGATLASGGSDKARFWDVETGIEQSLLVAPNEGALSVAISPDGATLASGNADGTVRLYLLRGADERRVLSAPPPPKRKAARRI